MQMCDLIIVVDAREVKEQDMYDGLIAPNNLIAMLAITAEQPQLFLHRLNSDLLFNSPLLPVIKPLGYQGL